MDDMVLAAMVKWPNVPACCGWLGLDTRGDWYMRDAAAQAAGPFQAACHAPLVGPAKGSRLQHVGLSAFIGRNYAVDETGRWYFQNGPQRVFVELASTPWVWRLDAEGRVHAHTGGAVARVLECVLDGGAFVFAHQPGVGPGAQPGRATGRCRCGGGHLATGGHGGRRIAGPVWLRGQPCGFNPMKKPPGLFPGGRF